MAWHNATFKNAAVEIAKLKVKLQNLVNQGNASDNLEAIKKIRVDIDNLWKQEEMYWGQRSKLKWLTCGDKNTKFFHATTIQRRDRNRLQRIQGMVFGWKAKVTLCKVLRITSRKSMCLLMAIFPLVAFR